MGVSMLRAISLALALLWPAGLQAQESYPARPIKLVLPFGAGGGGDVLGRLLAEFMEKHLKGTIVVENRMGAGGRTGTRSVASSAPDGYTIMIGGMTTHILAPAAYSALPYDPIKDFATIGGIGTSAILFVAAKDFPANDLKGLVAMAKAKPNDVQYATWGLGSTGHFCAEILSQKAGITMQHIPYNGASRIMNDILGNHIKLGVVDMATGTPLVQDGSVKALGVCTQRSPSLPDVPSFKEQDIDFDQLLSWVMYAPAGVPPAVRDQLSAALKTALEDATIKSRLLSLGISARFVPGDEQAATNARDIQVWRDVAQLAKIKLD
jgi:tripartite-type tricarboxylate transporter receptor subunit TctC